jgi:SAM-dependent methyltransferase
VSYLFTDDQRGRIKAAEDLLDAGTIQILERVGVPAGWRCLEVGAGGGSIARWLAERVAPTGRVVATDINTRDLDVGRHVELEVRQHDIVNDALEESSFDLVHARLVLEHLPQRDQVFLKLASALRPGGWLVIEDTDYVSGVPISEHGARDHEHTQSVRLQELRLPASTTRSDVSCQHTCGRSGWRMSPMRVECGLWRVAPPARLGSDCPWTICAPDWSGWAS